MSHASRREFLSAGAAALATAASIGLAGSQPQPVSKPVETLAPGPGKRTLKKAVMAGMVGEGSSVLEKFQILRD